MKEKLIGIFGALAVVFAVVVGTAFLESRIKPVTPDVSVQVDPTPEPAPAPQPQPDRLVKIVAPTKVQPGELVVLVAEGEATSYRWRVIPETSNFLEIDGGRRAVFSHGGSGKFMFVLAVAKDGQVDVQIHTVQIGDGTEPMTPSNDLTGMVATWCDAIESPTKRDDAIKLAQSFLSVASAISAGVVTSPQDILEATKRSNREALSEEGLQVWSPFFENLRDELNARGKNGELNDAAAHAEMWRAIGEALRKYAESL